MQINNINGISFNGLRFQNISGKNMKEFILPYFSQLETLGKKADLLVKESAINVRGFDVPALAFKATALACFKGQHFKNSATVRCALSNVSNSPLAAAQEATMKALIGL